MSLNVIALLINPVNLTVIPLNDFSTTAFLKTRALDIIEKSSDLKGNLKTHLDTGRKLDVHKTFRRRPGRFMYVQFTSCDYGGGFNFSIRESYTRESYRFYCMNFGVRLYQA